MENLEKYLESKNWFSVGIDNRYNNQINTYGMEIQTMAHQKNTLHYFNLQKGFYERNNTSDLIAKIVKKPVRIHSRISPNSAQFLSSWFINCSSEPVELAKSVVQYFTANPTNLQIFASITFPSLFHHFLSFEFLENATIFLENLFPIAPSDMFSKFFASFILNCPKFIYTLWSTYKQNAIDYGIETSSDCMTVFIESLSVAASRLTKNHVKIIDMFYEKHPEIMAAALTQDVFISSFIEFFHYSKEVDETNNLITLLVFAATKPTTAQFSLIIDTLHPAYFACPIPHEALSYTAKTPFVTSCHECLMIQNLVINNETLRKLRIVNSLLLKDTLNNDFEPLFIEISVKKPLNLSAHLTDPLVYKRMTKLKVKERPKFVRSWSEIAQRIPNPLDVFTMKPDTPALSELLERVGSTLLNDQDFVKYARSCEFDKVVESQTFFEDVVDLMDSANTLCNEHFFFQATLEVQLGVTWQGMFGSSTVFGPVITVSQQKKRRASFSSSKINAEPLPKPVIVQEACEQPLQKPALIGLENETIIQVTPALIEHKSACDESPVKKLHTLLTKCVLPLARKWIYAKCLDEFDFEDNKFDELKKEFASALKQLAFKFSFEENPINAIVAHYSGVNEPIYYEKLERISEKFDFIEKQIISLAGIKPGTATIQILAIAQIISDLISTYVMDDKDPKFTEFCSGVTCAMIVHSQNSGVINSFFVSERILSNSGEFRTIIQSSNSGSIRFIERAIWHLLKDTSEELTNVAIKVSGSKIF